MGRQITKTSAGDLRVHFKIYETQESDDGQGGKARLPVEVDAGWGDIQSLSPFRRQSSAQAQQPVTHRVIFRYAQRLIKPSDELRYRDHNLVTHRLSTRTVVDVDMRAKRISVEAEELTEVNANNPDLA